MGYGAGAGVNVQRSTYNFQLSSEGNEWKPKRNSPLLLRLLRLFAAIPSRFSNDPDFVRNHPNLDLLKAFFERLLETNEELGILRRVFDINDDSQVTHV